jgi:putative sigma-54 modulation protein
MNINIKATHIELTPSIKEYIEEKIGGLGKYIVASEAHVELARDKHHQTGLVFHSDINLIVGNKVMHAEAEGEDAYAAIDLLIPKLKEQIGKFKDKRQTLQRRGGRSAKRKI